MSESSGSRRSGALISSNVCWQHLLAPHEIPSQDFYGLAVRFSEKAMHSALPPFCGHDFCGNSQFSRGRAGTHANSRSLSVTSVAPIATA